MLEPDMKLLQERDNAVLQEFFKVAFTGSISNDDQSSICCYASRDSSIISAEWTSFHHTHDVNVCKCTVKRPSLLSKWKRDSSKNKIRTQSLISEDISCTKQNVQHDDAAA